MSELWLPLLPFAILWLLMFGLAPGKPCPDCGEILPQVQSPFTKTKRQWIEGGYLCRNCGCEADYAGRKVVAGTEPSKIRLMVTGTALFVSVIIGLILITMAGLLR